MKNKLFLALGALVVVGIGAFGVTQAFFTDTETVEGNTFTAGAIDVTIASAQEFTVEDMKPGDLRTANVSFSAESNPYYACGAFDVTANEDNNVLDPEREEGDTTANNNGELQNFVELRFIDKDGNVAGSPISLANASGTYTTIADSQTDVDGIAPGVTRDYTVEACFGEFDENGNCTVEFPMNDEDNVAQTDRVSGTVQVLAIQVRNNDNFVCSDLSGDGQGENGEEVVVTPQNVTGFATFQFGDGDQTTDQAPNFETAVGTSEASLADTGGFDLTSGTPERFNLSQQVFAGFGSKSLKFDIESNSGGQAFVQNAGEPITVNTANALVITAFINEGQMITVNNLQLAVNDNDISQAQSSEIVSPSGSFTLTDSDGDGVAQIIIRESEFTDLQFEDEFDLEGDVTFTYTGTNTDPDRPSLEFEIGTLPAS